MVQPAELESRDTTIVTGNTDQVSNTLMTSGSLTCSACKNILVPPVWLTVLNTNICNSCQEILKNGGNPDYGYSIINQPFNMILPHLGSPCQYKERGCKELLTYPQYNLHVSECIYSGICIFPKCSWVAPQREFMLHLKQSHPDNVMCSDNNVFSIKTEALQADNYYVLETINGRFIARMVRNENKLNVLIYDHDKSTDFKSLFRLSQAHGNCHTATYQCKISDDMSQLTALDTRYVTTVDLQSLNPNGRVYLMHHLDVKIPPVPSELFRHFRCCKCERYNKNSIWECEEGHSICDSCLLVSNEIHVCTNDATVKRRYLKRNTALEVLAKCSLLPCSYDKFGCKLKIPSTSTHEYNCEYKSVKCPIGSCSYADSYVKLITHFKHLHGHNQTSNYAVFPFDSAQSSTNFLICHHMIFKVRYAEVDGYDRKGYRGKLHSWSIVQVGLEAETSNSFMYTLGIISEPLSKQFTFTDFCHNEAYYKNDKVGFMLSETEEKWNFSGKDIKFYVRIQKKEDVGKYN